MFQQAVLYPSFVIPYPISENNCKDIQLAVHNVLCNPKYPLQDKLFTRIFFKQFLIFNICNRKYSLPDNVTPFNKQILSSCTILFKMAFFSVLLYNFQQANVFKISYCYNVISQY